MAKFYLNKLIIFLVVCIFEPALESECHDSKRNKSLSCAKVEKKLLTKK